MPHEDSPPTHILRLIINACTGSAPALPAVLDWPDLLSTAFAEHLQGLLYRAATCLSAPDPVIQTLANAYYHQTAANMLRIRAIESLEAALAESQITVMAFKGAALVDSAYTDPGLRPMEDMDLLIRPADRNAFEALLLSCGYRPDPIFAHLFAKDGVILDLHAHPLNADRVAVRRHLFPIDTDTLWAESICWRPGFRYVRRPSDADHVLILTHHLIKHSFSKMIWLVDIHRLLKNRDSLFWCELNRKISAYSQRRPMAFLLYLLEALVGEAPAGIRIGMAPEKILTRFERAMLDIRIRGDGIGDLGNFLWWRCLPDRDNLLWFGLETLFPRREVLAREQAEMPATSERSLYLHRSAEILRRIWKNTILLSRGLRKSGAFSRHP